MRIPSLTVTMQTHLALLTPVPADHLLSGLEVCAREGRVAFGSNNGLRLAELRHDLEGEECDVLFFASQEGLSGPTKVTWVGRFKGLREPRNGRHPEHERLRPLTTDGDGAWMIFYEVSDLRKLGPGEAIPIASLKSSTGKKLSATYIPEGPLIVETPW